MPNIYVCFVWHMHQPFYKDLRTGEYMMPWTRMHALKDYYGMVQVLKDFPDVHQTFNVVPSMLEQIQDYAKGTAVDPFLRAALKPSEQLTPDEQTFVLNYFFQAHPHHLIGRYPRYKELYDAWNSAGRDANKARNLFSAQPMRDLQVLSQLAWFDEEFLANDPAVIELVKKGRNYSHEDQSLMGAKQTEILNVVIPTYREFAHRGQVELSTTPFYHPILPLLCDSNIASTARPFVPLPSRFKYPQDAVHQLQTSREYHTQLFGQPPTGLWPSEGSVSDEVFAIAADLGFRWAATDNGVLSRTLQQNAGVEQTYRPWVWKRDGREMRVLFRDHYLSDLIGFVYSRMDAAEAAAHFVKLIHENCAPILASGRDALVPVILDGENAWEHYHLNGRPFLRHLYQRITDDPRMHAVTVSEALDKVEPSALGHIFPGSWINANFDIWIGAEEDNQAWEILLNARKAFEQATAQPGLSEQDRKLAFEELLIAEGSDWCWWYGPEHHTDNREEFDRLFRSHIANVYHALKLLPPNELSQPILKTHVECFHNPPTETLTPTIDGKASSYFEWMGAGIYRMDARQGAMHGGQFNFPELQYGCDAEHIYLRLDFPPEEEPFRLHLGIQNGISADIEFGPAGAKVTTENSKVESAFDKILEIKAPKPNHPVSIQVSLWQGSLPLDSMPRQGWLELGVPESSGWCV